MTLSPVVNRSKKREPITNGLIVFVDIKQHNLRVGAHWDPRLAHAEALCLKFRTLL